MELWIRSQDKDILLKVDSLLIDDNNNDIYTQCWVGVNLETYTLGKYKTKERALQVLDEIQNILQPIIITHEPVIDYDDMIHSLSENVAIHCTQQIETELKQAGQVVYQMPEE